MINLYYWICTILGAVSLYQSYDVQACIFAVGAMILSSIDYALKNATLVTIKEKPNQEKQNEAV